MNDYTELSRATMDQALSTSLTAEEACGWLLHSASFRTLPEKLTRFYSGTEDELKALLRNGLNSLHPDAGSRDAIRHNITNWFSPVKGIDDRTISTQYAYEISFLLGLTLDTADQFLIMVTGEGVHYRDLGEFILAFGLKRRMSCREALELKDELMREVGPFLQRDDTPKNYTKLCKEDISLLSTRGELRNYVLEHKSIFGAYRNTAYEYFSGMMKVLQGEGTEASVEELVAQNLYRRFVQKNKRISEVEKSIRSGWPETSSLSRMSRRELPITRKVLILLFLASGGGISKAPSDDDFDDTFGPEGDRTEGDDEFEAIFVQLNAMLADCGFMSIDPRSPFDWMVLFCIATGDVFDFDRRFEEILSRLFGNDPQIPRS